MDYINIYGISIPTYSLMGIIGLMVGNILAYKIIKKEKLIVEDFIVIQAYGLSFGMLGAKLLFLWVSRKQIDWNRIFELEYFEQVMKGGFVFYGGLIGCFIGILLVNIIHKINVKEFMEKLIFFIPLVHGFGRVGCYFAGCCYGIPYDGPFHVEYHNIHYSLCDVKLFPIQLVEAILLFILALILFRRVNNNKSSLKSVYFYLISYSIIRFILEEFRYDENRGRVLNLSTSQWISIIILCISYITLKKCNSLRNESKEAFH